MTNNVGRVVQIIGPVLDIKFENGSLPPLLGAIEIEHEGAKVVCEVAMQLGDDTVRCIAMSSTDGMSRGMEAVYTGKGITVPVGPETLGRIFNLLGEPIDNGPEVKGSERWEIHPQVWASVSPLLNGKLALSDFPGSRASETPGKLSWVPSPCQYLWGDRQKQRLEPALVEFPAS